MLYIFNLLIIPAMGIENNNDLEWSKSDEAIATPSSRIQDADEGNNWTSWSNWLGSNPNLTD